MKMNFDPQTYKYRFYRDGNVKLGTSVASWSTLKGSERLWIKELKAKVTGTCKNCSSCTNDCYVNKSYLRYPNVKLAHAKNAVGLRQAFDKVFSDLNNQIKNAVNKIKIVRINQSGELRDEKELLAWCNLAKNNKETSFYVYTKNYDVATAVLLEKRVPNNMTILYSIWHENGKKEYESVKHLPNVKAFVYDDGNVSVKPQSYCMAYNEKGHMNHKITCEKCRKCFNNKSKIKIIGCHEH